MFLQKNGFKFWPSAKWLTVKCERDLRSEVVRPVLPTKCSPSSTEFDRRVRCWVEEHGRIEGGVWRGRIHQIVKVKCPPLRLDLNCQNMRTSSNLRLLAQHPIILGELEIRIGIADFYLVHKAIPCRIRHIIRVNRNHDGPEDLYGGACATLRQAVTN